MVDVKSETAELLTEGALISDGARNKSHGNKERAFIAIAEAWTFYLKNRQSGLSSDILPEDVAWMMMLLKLCRRLHGQPLRDHYLDAAVYAAMGWELNWERNTDDRTKVSA